ncbi:MAG: glcK 1 [Paenibacillus sp.]|nr:glcK 1 [Paenibacillus sp.]
MGANSQYVIGIDIGGTKCAITLVRLNAAIDDSLDIADIEFVEKIKWPTEELKGPDAAIATFIQSTRVLLERHGLSTDDLLRIGISCGGPLSSEEGLILSPPNLPGWDHVPIVARIAEAIDVPVKMHNDANACALAEWKFGAGRGLRNMVFLTFGTGMGAGLIMDGRLYIGTNDMAGEVGHMRLAPTGPYGFHKSGSFEGFCSGGGIAKLGKQVVLEKLLKGEAVGFCSTLEELPAITAEQIGKAAAQGDPTAIEIFRCSGEYLGVGLALLIDILNPQAIVIGSIFGRQYDILWPAAKEVLEREALSYALQVCRVVPAGLGERVGDYAALTVAIYS